MKISDDGLERLEQREGKRNRAYKDTKGVWTIGVGHTGPHVYEGLAWTDQQITDALRDDVKIAEDCINKYVHVPLTQNQFDALVSFIFNIGITHFITSTLLRDLNAGDYVKAAEDFMMWNKPPEILGRRLTEKQQFLAS
jgi:lysozyme